MKSRREPQPYLLRRNYMASGHYVLTDRDSGTVIGAVWPVAYGWIARVGEPLGAGPVFRGVGQRQVAAQAWRAWAEATISGSN